MARLLLIGLDGFGFDFASRVCEARTMPFLADRAASGAFGAAASTIPPVSTAAWTTITTGVGPGKHGLVDFRRRELAAYGFVSPGRFIHDGDVRAPRLYDLAGEAGARCFVLNVPATFPARRVNGVLVAGMLTPPGSDRGCWPADFRRHLTGYAYDLEDPIPVDLGALCGRLGELAASRARLAAAAMRGERFDLGIVVFTGPDRLFHRFYDDVYASGDPPAAAASYLRAVDEACEEVYEAFGADAALLVCSDHGFGPGPRRAFFVNRLLRGAGYLTAGGASGKYALNVVWEGFKKLFGRGRPLPVNWRRTVAYGFPFYERWGGVVLNASAEQAEGTVPAEEMPALTAELGELLGRRGDETGAAPLWVKTREELYRGPAVTDFPHVIFEAPPGFTVSEAKGPGPFVAPYENASKRGEHTREAMVLVAGGGVGEANLGEAKLEDVAATAAALLGLRREGMDGRSWV